MHFLETRICSLSKCAFKAILYLSVFRLRIVFLLLIYKRFLYFQTFTRNMILKYAIPRVVFHSLDSMLGGVKPFDCDETQFVFLWLLVLPVFCLRGAESHGLAQVSPESYILLSFIWVFSVFWIKFYMRRKLRAQVCSLANRYPVVSKNYWRSSFLGNGLGTAINWPRERWVLACAHNYNSPITYSSLYWLDDYHSV